MSRVVILVVACAALASACGIGDAQANLRTAVDAKQAELDQCYTSALARNGETQGSLAADLNVESQGGRVESVEFTGGDVQDGELTSCMTGVLTQIQLQEAPAANLRVSYSFELSPAN